MIENRKGENKESNKLSISKNFTLRTTKRSDRNTENFPVSKLFRDPDKFPFDLTEFHQNDHS